MGLARAFAETCWAPLMLDVYRLGYENDYQVPIEVGGRYQPWSPKMAEYSEDCEVSVALTPEEGEKHAQRLLAISNVMAADPELAPLYGAKERYAVMSQVFDLLGEPNWLCDPATEEGQMRMAQAAQQKALAMQMEMQKAGAPMAKAQADAAHKQQSLALDALQKADQQALKEAEFQWQRETDKAEIKLETQQKRPVAIDRPKSRAG